MKKIKSIIIDLDDTLTAFDVVTDDSWNEVCNDFCNTYTHVDQDNLYNEILKENDWYWSDPERHRIGRQNNEKARRMIMVKVFKTNKFGTHEAAIQLADAYSKTRMDKIFLFPAVHQTLKKLKDQGYTLILMTNGDASTQRLKINRFELAGFFDKILVEGELGFGKPDPRVYQLALDFAEAEPHEVVIVGDNLKWEIGVPNEIGMSTIWMNYKKRKVRTADDPRPHAEIHSVEELPDVIFKMSNCDL